MLVNCDYHLVHAEIQPFSYGINDSDIGLVWYELVNLAFLDSVCVKNLDYRIPEG